MRSLRNFCELCKYDMNSKKGSILILTLWVLSFLTIFAVGLSHNVSGQLRMASYFQDRLKAYYLANAGIERAIVELAADQASAYDSLNEAWANNEEFFKEAPVGNGYITLSYTMTRLGENEQAESGEDESEEDGVEQVVLYGVMDENSRVNINKIPVNILEILLERIGELKQDEAKEIANAIVDWRDTDIIISPGGAESNYYEGLKMPYECKNGEFQAIEELLLVKGMTPEIFSKLQNVITIYGEGKININTVDATTLYGLGLDMNFAEAVVEFRQGSDAKMGTDDDNVFTTTGELREVGPFFTEESTQINYILDVLTVTSDIFRINSFGIFETGQRRLRRNIVCVVKRQKTALPEILYWREN